MPKSKRQKEKGNREERSVPKSKRQKGKGEQRGALNYQKQETKKKKDTDSRTFLEQAITYRIFVKKQEEFLYLLEKWSEVGF